MSSEARKRERESTVRTHVSVEADLHEASFEVAVGAHEEHRAVRLIERSRVMRYILAKREQVLVLDVGSHVCRFNF